MSCLLVLPVAAYLAVHLNKKFEETVGTAVGAVLLPVFLSGLFGSFIPGLLTAGLMSAASAVLLVYGQLTGRCIIFPKGSVRARNIVFSSFSGLLIMLALLALTSFHRGINPHFSDDFGHWFLALKNSFYYNSFSNTAISTDDLFSSYPPLATLWGYISLRILGRYSDSAAIFSQSALIVLLMLPAYAVLNRRKQMTEWLFCSLFVFLIPIIAGSSEFVYTSLYVDILLGAESFAMVYYGYRYLAGRESFYKVSCAVMAAMLCMTKDFGIVIAGCNLIAVLYAESRLSGERRIARLLSGKMPVLLSMIASELVWHGYLKLYSACYSGPEYFQTYEKLAPKAVQDVSLSSAAAKAARPGSGAPFAALFVQPGKVRDTAAGVLGQVKDLLHLNRDFSYVKMVTASYFNGLFDTERFSLGFAPRMPYFTAVLMLMLVFVLFREHADDRDNAERTASAAEYMAKGCFAAMLIYDLALLVAYILLFPRYDAQYLAGFQRYMAPMLMSQAGITVFCIYGGNRRTGRKTLAGLLILLLLTDLRIPFNMMITRPDSMDYENVSFDGKWNSVNTKVFYISQNGKKDVRAFYYYVFPATSNLKMYSMTGNLESRYSAGKEPEYISVRDFTAMIREEGYQYVYIDETDERFMELYSELFADPGEYPENRVFHIISDQKGILLSAVNNKTGQE